MAKRPRIIRFPKAKVADDSQFVETLVWVLSQARKGSILGYAMVFMVKEDGHVRTIEAAKSFDRDDDRDDRLHVLGGMRRMELNFIKREWPEEE